MESSAGEQMLIFTELMTLEVVDTEDMNISFYIFIDVQLKKMSWEMC